MFLQIPWEVSQSAVCLHSLHHYLYLCFTISDALKATRAPLIFSHSSARSVANVTRNVPDDVLEKVVSILLLSFLLIYEKMWWFLWKIAFWFPGISPINAYFHFHFWIWFVTYFMLEIHLLQYQTYTEVLVIVSELKKKFMLHFSCPLLEFRILIQR